MLEIRETFTNRATGAELGEVPYWRTPYESASQLYVWLRREYGRCDARLWAQDGAGVWWPVGWRFVARVPVDESRRVWPSAWYTRVTEVEVRQWLEAVGAEARVQERPPQPHERGAA